MRVVKAVENNILNAIANAPIARESMDRRLRIPLIISACSVSCSTRYTLPITLSPTMTGAQISLVKLSVSKVEENTNFPENTLFISP